LNVKPRSLTEGALACLVAALLLKSVENYLIATCWTPEPAALARLGWTLLLALAARSVLLGVALGLLAAVLVTVAERWPTAGVLQERDEVG
jgi:hypothetical protein